MIDFKNFLIILVIAIIFLFLLKSDFNSICKKGGGKEQGMTIFINHKGQKKPLDVGVDNTIKDIEKILSEEENTGGILLLNGKVLRTGNPFLADAGIGAEMTLDYTKKLDEMNLDGADLKGANLRDIDLTDLPLRINVYTLDLTGADLSGATMSGLDIGKMKITGANLRGADLTGANLSGADLRGVNLREADFTEAKFINTIVESSDFTEAKFINTKFTRTEIIECKFLKTLFKNTRIIYGKIEFCNFTNAEFVNIQFFELPLEHLNFSKASLNDVYFQDNGRDGTMDNYKLKMENVSFKGAKLKDVIFDGRLKNVDFTEAKIESVTVGDYSRIIGTDTNKIKELKINPYVLVEYESPNYFTINFPHGVNLTREQVNASREAERHKKVEGSNCAIM